MAPRKSSRVQNTSYKYKKGDLVEVSSNDIICNVHDTWHFVFYDLTLRVGWPYDMKSPSHISGTVMNLISVCLNLLLSYLLEVIYPVRMYYAVGTGWHHIIISLSLMSHAATAFFLSSTMYTTPHQFIVQPQWIYRPRQTCQKVCARNLACSSWSLSHNKNRGGPREGPRTIDWRWCRRQAQTAQIFDPCNCLKQ